jgi:hypothetical protein
VRVRIREMDWGINSELRPAEASKSASASADTEQFPAYAESLPIAVPRLHVVHKKQRYI